MTSNCIRLSYFLLTLSDTSALTLLTNEEVKNRIHIYFSITNKHNELYVVVDLGSFLQVIQLDLIKIRACTAKSYTADLMKIKHVCS